MSFALLFFVTLTLTLTVLLLWVVRSTSDGRISGAEIKSTETPGRQHLTYFPQMYQAIGGADFQFLRSRGSERLVRRVRKERRAIALRYLACLRAEFMKLWRLARVVAAMSPQVAAMGELERFRLGVVFNLRFEILRAKFVLGFPAVPDFRSLSEALSKLSIRLETAVNEVGERAAIAS